MLYLGNHFSEQSQLFSVSWIYQKPLLDNFPNPYRCDFHVSEYHRIKLKNYVSYNANI